jgi:excisionase family DNA binding protein
MSADRYLTQSEVCSRLRISRKTLQVYRKQGRIQFRNFGHRSIRIKESELAQFVAAVTDAQLTPSERVAAHMVTGDDSIFVELIPDDKLPIDCGAPLERCAATAAVWVTSSSGYQRRPMCVGHAHVVFAEWMVGI